MGPRLQGPFGSWPSLELYATNLFFITSLTFMLINFQFGLCNNFFVVIRAKPGTGVGILNINFENLFLIIAKISKKVA